MKRNIISPKLQLEINNETTLSQGVEIVFENRIMVLVQLLEEQQKQIILTPELIHNLRVTCRRLISARTLFEKSTSKSLIAK